MNRDRIRRGLLASLLTTLFVLVFAGAALANSITVNDTGDPTGPGDCLNSGQCSLRQAVVAASSGDTIQLPGAADSPAVYTLTQGATLAVAKNLTIQGSGPGAAIIDGSGNNGGSNNQGFRILTVSGGTVTIRGVTFRNGSDGNDEQLQSCSPCETLNANGGGAVFNNGATVSLDNVAFTNDSAPVGGAVSNGNGGTLSMTDVSFTDNGGGIGGALFTHSGTVNGTGVTFENNGSGSFGGGAAYLGGGIVNLTNATVVGNGWASSFGGGIENADATLTLLNDTFSGNLRGAIETDYGTTKVANTIIGAGFSDGSDFACVAAGKQNDNGFTTSNAITTDLGYNIDQDGHCNLTGATDQSNVDPKPAPIADNGGPTHTQALLAGSPALHDPATTNCPATDQRGTARPSGSCDIGAFEAVLYGPPSTPTTDDAQNVTDTSADLAGTINLNGEAGGFHFVYGTAPGDLSNQTDEAAAGVVSTDTPETETLSYLTPDTTYYYAIVADNATDSISSENVKSFTTQPGPPVIGYDVSVDSITDTTATIHFSINPQGSDTTYYIEYGPDSGYGQQTQTEDIGSAPGAQNLSATLTGLDPGSTVYFDIVASNAVQQDVHSDNNSFSTLEQLTGVAGRPANLTDHGSSYGCPTADGTTVDWGDHTSDTGAQIQCSEGYDDETDYDLSDSHIYTNPGDYKIAITYSDLGVETDVIAHISPNTGAPTNTALPTISGIAQQGQTLSTTNGTWTGNPTSFGYQWQDCDASGQNCTNTGGDANTYALTSGDVGHTIQVVVTATGAGGSAHATSNRTAVVSAQAGPSPTRSSPTVGAVSAQKVKVTTAGFSGTATPNGLPTQAYFQYGLDPKYSGGGPVVYDHATPAQPVGSDFSSHAVGPVAISGLLPNALYHVRLVATNSAGTTFGPDVTFTTAPAPAPGRPTLGKTVDVTPVSGFVLIKIRGKFVPLTGADQIPSGSQIDARHGSLELITSTGQKRGTQHGTFGGAIFKLTQERSGASRGLVTLALVEGAFKGAPSYAICKAHVAADPTATTASSKTLQLLKASAHGKFRTKGRYSAATVRGTKWTVADRCDGTLTHVITDSVAVTDLVRHKTIILHAGQSYLAKARKHK